MTIDIEELRAMMEALDEFGFDELQYKNDDVKIRIVRRSQSQQLVAASLPPAPVASPSPGGNPATTSVDESPVDQDSGDFITCPFVGTFYAAPSPESEPFVKVGSIIEPGTVLCIVEAMKLMNEIESEVSGEVLEVLVENGKPVEFGDKLFRIKKTG